MDTTNKFERMFFEALSDAPEMPDCYPGIRRRIRRHNAMVRTAWAVAAALAIAAGTFQYAERTMQQQVATAAAEELQGVRTIVNGSDDAKPELVSYSLTNEDQY